MKSFSSIGFVLPLFKTQLPISSFEFPVRSFQFLNFQFSVTSFFLAVFPLSRGATASSSVLVMAGFFEEKKILRSPWRPLDDLSFRAKPHTVWCRAKREICFWLRPAGRAVHLLDYN